MCLLYKIWLLNSPAYERRVSSSIALEYFSIYLSSLKWTTTFWPIYDTFIIWLNAYHKGRFDYNLTSLHIFHKSTVSIAGSKPVFTFWCHFCLNYYFHPSRKITHPLQPWAIGGGGEDNGNRRHQRVSKLAVSRKLWHELSAPPLTRSAVSASLAPF